MNKVKHCLVLCSRLQRVPVARKNETVPPHQPHPHSRDARRHPAKARRHPANPNPSDGLRLQPGQPGPGRRLLLGRPAQHPAVPLELLPDAPVAPLGRNPPAPGARQLPHAQSREPRPLELQLAQLVHVGLVREHHQSQHVRVDDGSGAPDEQGLRRHLHMRLAGRARGDHLVKICAIDQTYLIQISKTVFCLFFQYHEYVKRQFLISVFLTSFLKH